MGAAFGLQTHIWNNNFKSVLLLAGFPLLLLLLMYGLFLLAVGLGGDWSGGAEQPFLIAASMMAQSWPFALIGAGLWFVIAYFGYQAMIDAATGARALTRQEAPEPYNLLENLCISRGITMPSLRVIETDALNAFASGLHPGQYSITLTRGLISALDRQELEAVIAHELTHIQNRDVRLLVIAVIFVGIFSFVFEMLFRGLNQGGVRIGGRSSSSSSEGGGGGGAAIAVIAGLVCIALAYALAIVIRFSLSRRREYLADAGAVELTKDPDALIRALRKISGHAEVESAPSEVREMFIENPHAGFGDMFATHPPIDKRIAALIAYAGGRDAGVTRRKSPWG
jgi:heat shock protein HtpX